MFPFSIFNYMTQSTPPPPAEAIPKTIIMNKYLLINAGENLEDKILHVSKGTKLLLKPGPKCVALKVTIETNYPINGKKFERQTYNQVPVSADHQDLISSCFNWQASVEVNLAGTFHFVCKNEGETIWRAYVIVNPELGLALNSIRCQTVLSKNLGPLKEWRQRLSLSKDLKYNMVHFTPIQQLGASNSAYSLRHQHKVNPAFGASLDEIKREMDFIHKKWSMLSVTDIVLNHTADDSEWIREHPESAYNLVNSPYLRPAFLLDCAFVWLAKDLVDGNLSKTDNLSAMICSELDVRKIGILLKTFYVPQLKIDELRGWLEHAVDNALNAIRYERLNPAGPYYGVPVSARAPLVAPYFTHTPLEQFDIRHELKLMDTKGHLFMAHNGWKMGSAGVEDLAGAPGSVYLRRELVAWGDCIKLRYGSGPHEAPYLWEHMRKYVESQAKMFHGLRIDNCHSTPVHVAEYFVDVARQIRPDIYLMAELFTSSEQTDNVFVNRLGLSALIRESMSAHSCRELGSLLYRFGGTPIGAFHQHGAEMLRPAVAHAIFYDQTHDNESAVLARTAWDVPASAALVSMAACATGSVRGYDELVPHHINVVTEARLYADKVPEDTGILPLRRLLNGMLRRELDQGFDEIFIDQNNDDVLAITRHNPRDGRSVVLVARTAFTNQPRACTIRPIHIQGRVGRLLFEAQAYGSDSKYTRNERFINGLSSFRTKIFSVNAPSDESKLVSVTNTLDEDEAIVRFNENTFLASSVVALEVCLSERQSEALRAIDKWRAHDVNKLNLSDANYVLFRCAEEDGVQAYELPRFQKFTYCGLWGLMYHLQKVRRDQDQAHPLAQNLRDGPWLADYIVGRLRRRPATLPLADQLELILAQMQTLPRGMVPKYFDLIVTRLYNALVEKIHSSMSIFVSKGPQLVKLLALSSVALVGECESAPMPALDSLKHDYVPSLAAGLPHFASGYMRNWGRDTFIALRGLLLITGRFVEAKAIILSYARTLKHGLIPNLLDGGLRSRYNCRDAIWWWLYSIREYTRMAPSGTEILRCKVSRLHAPRRRVTRKTSAVTAPVAPVQLNGAAQLQSLSDIIQEALECHFEGESFVEENAGKQLDEHMLDEGFQITIGVQRETGFVFGGNRFNCGTWMDKMGSSDKAKTKGLPASPRDGSAVEIIGLCKAAVSWLDEMFKQRAYPYDGVECLYDNTITLKWTWKKWAALLQANFEPHFFIPPQDAAAESLAHCDPKLINRRAIYKDTVGASLAWQDYQLRPNFLVAMVVAPELFNGEHARAALLQVKQHLCGPLGMRTLDPSDWNYRGDYDNGNDSSDPKVAHGYNYHQGPEWLWPTGYYIRAASRFLDKSERAHHLQLLSNFYSALVETPWLGLPELTNSNGQHCPGSCPIQAWSLGTALEALHESAKDS